MRRRLPLLLVALFACEPGPRKLATGPVDQLASDGTTLFWSTPDGVVRAMPLAGGAQQELYRGAGAAAAPAASCARPSRARAARSSPR
jgi:hypothetical protein